MTAYWRDRATRASWRRLSGITLLGTLFTAAGTLSYFIAFERLWGSTPGKRVLGLVVVTEDPGRCTLAAAIKRNLLYVRRSRLQAFHAALNGPVDEIEKK